MHPPVAATLVRVVVRHMVAAVLVLVFRPVAAMPKNRVFVVDRVRPIV
jgi:hypothetical protein